MNKVINDLWYQVYDHPLFTENIARKIKLEVTVGVIEGSNRFTLTRTLLTRTLEFLNMMQRIEERNP